MRCGILLLIAVAGSAQEPPHFQTRAREVVVPVSVFTKSGKPVEELTAADFVVLNDGKPETVRMLSRDSDPPLAVYAVLVLQTNDGGEAVLAKIRKTASVISTYITNDMGTTAPSLAAVISVSDDVRLEQDFTDNPDDLRQTFAKLKASGDSARLLDGVSLACDMLAARKEPARRIIILVSESRDRHSNAHFTDVILKAQTNDIAVYTLSYSAYTTAFTQKTSELPQPPDQPGAYDPNSNGGGIPLIAIGMELARLAKVNVAEALAHATGGGHDKFTTLHGLETRLSAVGTEIHNRYTLTFVPPDPQSAGYHHLDVTVHKPGQIRVHARAGYFTPN